MTTNDAVQALFAAAQDLVDRAASDPALADRLLADANGAVAEAAGQAVPGGIQLTAERRADGVVELSASVDAEFQGELDDAALDNVAGGTVIGVRGGSSAGGMQLQLIPGGRVLGGTGVALGTNFGTDI